MANVVTRSNNINNRKSTEIKQSKQSTSTTIMGNNEYVSKKMFQELVLKVNELNNIIKSTVTKCEELELKCNKLEAENAELKNGMKNKKVLQPQPKTKNKNVIMGDSIVRGASEYQNKETTVTCYPGINIKQIKNKIVSNEIVIKNTETILFHVGTNDINSAANPSVIMEDMRSLVKKVKTINKNIKIRVSGIIKRRDQDIRYIEAVNDCLDYLCKLENVIFVDSNLWIENSDLGRDGLHLNKRGVNKLGSLWSRVLNSGN